MLLIVHITVALLGLVISTLLVFTPTMRLLNSSRIAALITLVSGIILTVQHPSHLAQSCLVGLIYFSLVAINLFAGSRKLNKLTSISI